jgi:hypothetical protein
MSADKEQNTSFILTQKGHKYKTPIIGLEYPEFFHRETLQHICRFFKPEEIKINNECKYNYLGIQDELSIKYVLKNFDFVSKEDLIITYGGILLKYETLEDYQWTPIVIKTQHQGFSPDMNLNLLINYVIQKSII